MKVLRTAEQSENSTGDGGVRIGCLEHEPEEVVVDSTESTGAVYHIGDRFNEW
jgi:hypothetical protein